MNNEEFEEHKKVMIYLTLIACCLVAFSSLFTPGSALNIFSSNLFVSDNYFCQNNPEKCVCERKECDNKGISLNIPNEDSICQLGYYETCSQFRLKTQEESDIDDCNNNPREDETCKCQEWENTSMFCIDGNRLCTGYLSLKENPEYFKAIQVYINNKTATRFNKDYCTKSRPKTECEKGNIGWEEETIWEYEVSEESNMCPLTKFKSKFHSKGNAIFHSDATCVFNAQDNIKLVGNQTICREKTK